jgi:hypothetical protein
MASEGEEKKVKLILKGARIHIPELIIEEEE